MNHEQWTFTYIIPVRQSTIQPLPRCLMVPELSSVRICHGTSQWPAHLSQVTVLYSGCGNMKTPIKQSSRQGLQFLNSSLTQCSGSILSLSSLYICFTFLFQFLSAYFLLASAEIKFLSALRYKEFVKMETFTSFWKQESFNHYFCLYYPLKFKCEAKTLQHYE